MLSICGPHARASASRHPFEVSRRWQAARSCRNCTRIRAASGPSDARVAPDVDQLIANLEATDRGLNTSESAKTAILAAVEEFEAVGKGSCTTDDSLTATWRMVWTTEKETQFIIKNAKVFGTEAGEVYQVIDVAANSLQNVITFPPDGAFLVDSSIDVASDTRVDFKFRSATLKLPSRSIGLPPFGQGWFESVYMDDRIRIAKDIRKDILICVRDGPPRSFA